MTQPNAVTCVRDNTFEIIGPCPFCKVGGETLAVYRNENMRPPHRRYFVACDNCGASGPLGYNEVDATEGWNKAQPTPEQMADGGTGTGRELA